MYWAFFIFFYLTFNTVTQRKCPSQSVKSVHMAKLCLCCISYKTNVPEHCCSYKEEIYKWAVCLNFNVQVRNSRITLRTPVEEHASWFLCRLKSAFIERRPTFLMQNVSHLELDGKKKIALNNFWEINGGFGLTD